MIALIYISIGLAGGFYIEYKVMDHRVELERQYQATQYPEWACGPYDVNDRGEDRC